MTSNQIKLAMDNAFIRQRFVGGTSLLIGTPMPLSPLSLNSQFPGNLWRGPALAHCGSLAFTAGGGKEPLNLFKWAPTRIGPEASGGGRGGDKVNGWRPTNKVLCASQGHLKRLWERGSHGVFKQLMKRLSTQFVLQATGTLDQGAQGSNRLQSSD